jgi:hypothetical protein
MLDFSKLTTPAADGEVLVVPGPGDLVAMATVNRKALGAAPNGFLDATLADWRRRTREAIVGSDERPVVVIGHQPGFIHPGVWAKHIVAMRLARAVDGVAVNLVVDSDAPRTTTLAVPAVSEGRVTVRPIRFPQATTGLGYEQIPRQLPAAVHQFDRDLRRAMEERYARSQMPTFVEALLQGGQAGDWVDQVVAARRSVEAERRIASAECSVQSRT